MLVVISFLIFILLLFFICQCSSFTFSFRHHHLPWTIAGFLHPFNTFSPAHRRVIRDTFIFSHSVIFLPRALWFWVGIFYPQAFLPYAPSQNFWHNLLSSRPPWEPAVLPRSLQNLIWCLKHRPSPSVCLINSNPQSFVQPRFVLIHVNIAKTFTCGENFNENIIFFRFSSW